MHSSTYMCCCEKNCRGKPHRKELISERQAMRSLGCCAATLLQSLYHLGSVSSNSTSLSACRSQHIREMLHDPCTGEGS